MTDFWRRTGLLPGTAFVVASNAPVAIIRQAMILKERYGDLIQICDGVADDVQINAAITALSSYGGEIKLSSGLFNIAATITLISNVSIIGSGYGYTAVVTNGTTILKQVANTNIFTANTKENFTVRNLKCLGQVGTFDGCAFSLISVVTSIFQDVVITNFTQGIVSPSGCGGNIYRNISILNSGKTAVGEAGAAWLTVAEVDSRIEGGGIGKSLGYTSIRLRDVASWFIDNFYIGQSAGYGFHFSGEYCILQGIKVYQSNQVGLGVDAASHDITIMSPALSDNGNDGISAGGERAGLWLVNGAKNITVIGGFSTEDRSGAARKQLYGIYDQTTTTNVQFVSVDVQNNVTAPIFLSGSVTKPINCIGYIAPGEVRTASGSLTAGNANAITFAWNDPELQDILAYRVVVEITTPGGTALSVIQVGVANDAVGTGLGSEFFTAIDANSAAVRDSYLAGDTGAQTKWVFVAKNGTATKAFIVGKILAQNAAALAGKYYIEYVGR